MLRVLIIVLFGFIGAQFFGFYETYIHELELDIARAGGAAALKTGEPTGDWAIDRRLYARDALRRAAPEEAPFTFIEEVEPEFAVDVAVERFEPRLPDSVEEVIAAGVGLVLGFIITAIVFAPFRSAKKSEKTVGQTKPRRRASRAGQRQHRPRGSVPAAGQVGAPRAAQAQRQRQRAAPPSNDKARRRGAATRPPVGADRRARRQETITRCRSYDHINPIWRARVPSD